MGIKRNEVAEPQWRPNDYARINKENLFSDELWGYTINWNLLLEQIKKTEEASQPIDRYIFPSRLFSAYIDILEANLYILDDLFYYQTGIRIGNMSNPNSVSHAIFSLRFWMMDSYKKVEMIYEGLIRIENHLIVCLKQKPFSEIADRLSKKGRYASELNTIDPTTFVYDYLKQPAYSYACDAYRDSTTDQNAMVNQIESILGFFENYKGLLSFFVNDFFLSAINIKNLAISFRQSKKGEEFIKPWRRDFEGSRDSLIVKMEKDPELGPWVNRYTHLREDENTTQLLFCDDCGFIKNKEEALNTDNWIRLLIIASVLQEYDEQHQATAEVDNDDDEEYETLLLKLTPYFKDEATATRFLNSVRLMNDKEIITLVKKYRDGGLCTDSSKGLWKVLHDANLYKPLYKNWNAQLNKG